MNHCVYTIIEVVHTEFIKVVYLNSNQKLGIGFVLGVLADFVKHIQRIGFT